MVTAIGREGLVSAVSVVGVLLLVEVLKVTEALGVDAALVPVTSRSMNRLPEWKAEVIAI